ncbi:hypothetical protein GCM10010492_05050 [Saccharothrix mutabilis subsp. mutabilis]|uniref:IPT/TIG domain-containing protein n=1 Tax=Saccharothrix mutabilis subsp. mutabilis TaxID=66855 RepID=A0ABP3CMD2_9PSEU
MCGVVAAVVAGGEPPAAEPARATASTAPAAETTTDTAAGTTRVGTIVPPADRTTRTTTTTKQSPGESGFAWLPWGPADPGDPPPIQWYGRLQSGECPDDGSADVPLWAAMRALCAVVVEGDVGRWSDVRVVAGPGKMPCLESAARALLERAVAWHERNPDRRPAVTFAQPGQGTACPPVVTGVAGPEEGCDVESTLRGPVAGGTALTFCGSGFDSAEVTVLVGGRAATPDYATTTQVAVRTPAADGPGAVRLEVVSRGQRVVVSEVFEYEAEVVPTS